MPDVAPYLIRPRPNSRSRSRFRCAFELSYIEFLHLQHRLHRLRVFDEAGQVRGNDLPGKPELVLQPAALALAASGGELGPIVVHFLPRVAPHDKRDCFGELENGTAVERGEPLAVQFECEVRILPFGSRLPSFVRSSVRRRELLNTVR